MKVRYSPSEQRGSLFKNSLVAISATAILFAVLPFLQFAEDINGPGSIEAPQIVAEIPPPAFVEEPPKVDEEKEKPEHPELEPPVPEIDLGDIGLLIHATGPGNGEGIRLSGGFSEYLDPDTLVFDSSMRDKQPKVLHQIRPIYPYALKQLSIEDWAIIEWIINPDGTVRSSKVIRSSHSDFAKSAVEAIMKTKWKPGEKAGEVVATRVRQQINFTL